MTPSSPLRNFSGFSYKKWSRRPTRLRWRLAHRSRQRRIVMPSKCATSELIDHDRRKLLTAAATGIAAAGVGRPCFPRIRPAAAATSDAIRPFRINIPDEALVDLRRHQGDALARETVADDSQGVPLATMQGLARYWATDYDWRKCEASSTPCRIRHRNRRAGHSLHPRALETRERAAAHRHARLARLDHRAVEDHRSAHQSHGHGASASDAFHLVIPSLPGYGFSAKPATTGWDPVAHRARLGRADETPRIHALRGARRRSGRP